MGGKSSSSTAQSQTHTSTTLGNTTTSNPYVTSTTNNSGTTSTFAPGSALDTLNSFVNDNITGLLQNYMNPTIDDTTNQAKLNSFTKNLNEESQKSFENNIINPLSSRNMIRSSQATDMYNQMQENINDSISDYTMELLGSSQENAAAMLSNLMGLYLNGYNIISNNQSQSLSTSSANAQKDSYGSATNSSKQDANAMDYINMAQGLVDMAVNLQSGGFIGGKGKKST